MPYGSTISAVIAKYGTLNAALFPNATIPEIWLDVAPQQQGSTQPNTPQRLPYTIIEDDGGEPKWTFGSGPTTPGQNAIISGGFTLTVWYESLADCEQAMAAILWNGAIPDLRQGIAFMTLDLLSPYMGMSVKPTTDQRKGGELSYRGKPVYSLMQKFDTKVALSGQGYP